MFKRMHMEDARAPQALVKEAEEVLAAFAAMEEARAKEKAEKEASKAAKIAAFAAATPEDVQEAAEDLTRRAAQEMARYIDWGIGRFERVNRRLAAPDGS